MRKPNIQGNEKSYYIEKDYIEIWKYEDDFVITDKDLPFIKLAIQILEEKIKRKELEKMILNAHKRGIKK